MVLIDNVSLQNLGTYMFFDDVCPESSLPLCDYLIKSNVVFTPGDTITLFLNSPGGDVTDGWAIIDLMESSRINIQTVAVGCIASMAVAIFIAGTKGKRIMAPRTATMTHQFSGAFYGKQHEFMAVRKYHDYLEQQFFEHFMRHTKLDEQGIKDILLRPSDTWLSPEECLEYGICDEIRQPWDSVGFKKTEEEKPKQVLTRRPKLAKP